MTLFEPSFVAKAVPDPVVTVAHPPRMPLTNGVVLTLMLPTVGRVKFKAAPALRVITPMLSVVAWPLLVTTTREDVPVVRVVDRTDCVVGADAFPFSDSVP